MMQSAHKAEDTQPYSERSLQLGAVRTAKGGVVHMHAPPWVEAGLTELDGRLVHLFRTMQQARPNDELRHTFLEVLDAFHDLRDLAKRLTPANEALIASPALAPHLEPTMASVSAPPEEIAAQDMVVGSFRRRPRGGILIAEAGKEIEITEGQVQILEDRQQLLDGDIIAAKDEGVWPSGKKRWFFTVLEHLGAPIQDRVVTFGTIERWDSFFFCTRTDSLTILFEPKDVRYHDLLEGAVVEFAYMETEVADGKVKGYILRKLEGDDFSPFFDPASTSGSRAPRRVATQESTGPAVHFVGEPSILVIGGRNWPHFRDGLTEFGARPSYLDGFDNNQNLESKLRGVDLVLVIKTAASHAMSGRAKGIVPKDRLYITSYENWSGFRNRLLIPAIIPTWNTALLPAAD